MSKRKRVVRSRTVGLKNPNAKRINERPVEADDRQPGHWEMSWQPCSNIPPKSVKLYILLMPLRISIASYEKSLKIMAPLYLTMRL